jgi:hypothetical protein
VNQPHHLVALVTLLALIFFMWTALRVGAARARYNVPAPAMSGAPEFDRAFRIQMNTLEGLVLFLPALWLFALYWNDLVAAGAGAVWILGRIIYAVGYSAAPQHRSWGFSIQSLASIFLLLGGLVGIGMATAGGGLF